LDKIQSSVVEYNRENTEKSDTVHSSFPHYAYNSLLPLELREKKWRFPHLQKNKGFSLLDNRLSIILGMINEHCQKSRKFPEKVSKKSLQETISKPGYMGSPHETENIAR